MYTSHIPFISSKNTENGFTLIEMMIVVAIIAILSTIAVPAYTDYIIRSKLTQAHAALANCQNLLEQRFQDTRSYNGAACPATDDFAAPVITVTATGYSITISGKTGGQVASFSYTVDNFNARSSAVASGGPSGWTGSTSCWVRQKDGKC
ncbi:MAG: hypothetical protein RLZZ352_612 [Pseudomonadota bacterium]|jgi:type IV pilus assembly protein PilE